MRKIRIEYIVCVLGLLLYLASSSLNPFPGESSNLLLSHGWIHDFQLPSHPLWGFLTAFVSWLPFPLAAKMNVLSAIFSATALLLLYRVLYNSRLDSDYDERTPSARTMMSLAGPLYLLCLLPIWFVSNRAHYASFEMLLFLIAVRMLQNYRDRGGLLRLAGMGVVFGLGVVESSTFVAAAPILGLYIVYLMWHNKHIAPVPIALAAASFLLALALFMIPVWLYTRTGVYSWGGASNFWHAAWLTYSSGARTLRNQIGQVGWIILLMTSLIPYVGAMWLKRSQPVENRPFSVLAIAFIVFILGAVLLFNVPISPWVLLPRTIGFPLSVLILAVAFAISVGFWTAFFKDRRRSRRTRRSSPQSTGRKTETLFAVILLGLAAAAGVVNSKKVVPRINAEMAAVAEIIASGLPQDALVLSSGQLDSSVKLAAVERGVECAFINLKMASHPIYRNYMRELIDSPRTERLIDINLRAAVKEWLVSSPDAASRAAFFGSPEWWRRSGYIPLWRDGLYYGMTPDAKPDLDQLYDSQQDVWKRARAILAADGAGEESATPLLRSLALMMARGINDFGVYLERGERPELAADAYRNALALDDSNLVVAMNLYSCPAVEESERAALLDIASDQLSRIEFLSSEDLIKRYGYIARRESVQQMQKLMAAESEAKLVDGEAETPAAEKPDPEDNAAFKRATELMGRKKWAEAIVICRKLVKKRPEYSKVWTVMGVAAYESKDYETLDDCLQAMLAAEKFWPDLVSVAALAARDKGELERARRLFTAILRIQSDNPRLLEELLKIDVALGGGKNSEAYLGRLLDLDSDNFFGNFILGMRLYQRGKLELALEAYEVCLAQGQTYALLNNMAWLCNLLGDGERALDLIGRSLEINDKMSASWDTLGAIRLKRGEYEEAEQALERALELRPEAISPQINMIELKVARGDMKAASELALELESRESSMSPEQRRRLAEILER